MGSPLPSGSYNKGSIEVKAVREKCIWKPAEGALLTEKAFWGRLYLTRMGREENENEGEEKVEGDEEQGRKKGVLE